YEFEMRWRLWVPEPSPAGLDTAWRLEPVRVRVVGFGPNFDLGSYEQNGHIRVDFGLDTPWTFEGSEESPSTKTPPSAFSRMSKSSSPSPSPSKNTAASPAASSGPSPVNPSPKNSSPASSASTKLSR